MIAPGSIRIVLRKSYSIPARERRSQGSPHRDGKGKPAAIASVVGGKAPKDSEVDLCLRQS